MMLFRWRVTHLDGMLRDESYNAARQKLFKYCHYFIAGRLQSQAGGIDTKPFS
jgi:hypothetical protein